MNPTNQQRRMSSQDYAQQEQVQQLHSQTRDSVFIRTPGNTQGRMSQQHVVSNMPMHRGDHQMASGSGHMVYAQHQVQGQQHHMQGRPIVQQTTVLGGMPSQQQMRQTPSQQRSIPSQQASQMQRPPTPQQHQMQRPPTPQQHQMQRPPTPQQHQMQRPPTPQKHQMQRPSTPQHHQMQRLSTPQHHQMQQRLQTSGQQMQQGQQPMQQGQIQSNQQPMQQGQIQSNQQPMQQPVSQNQMQRSQQTMQLGQIQQSQQQMQHGQPQMQQTQIPQQPQTTQKMMPPAKLLMQQRVNTPQLTTNLNSNLTKTQIQDVNKLGRLLRTTIILAAKGGHERGVKMAGYVSQLIHSELTESEFATKLTETVGHSPQQKLLEFFDTALPFLRNEILSGRLPIDSVIKGSPANFHGLSPQLSTTPSVASPMSRHLVEPGSEPAHPPRANIPYSPLTQPPASAPTMDPTTSTVFTEAQQHQQQSFQQIVYHANTGNTATPQITQFLVPHPPQQQNQPQVVVNQQQMVQVVQQPTATVSSVTAPVLVPEDGVVFQSVDEMETAEPPPHQPTLINSSALAEVLTKKAQGAAIEEGVVRLVSDCVEARIKALIKQASDAAESRLSTYRNDSNFIEADDPRGQLRFLQKYETAVNKRRLETEKEKGMSSKPKGKAKDLDALEKAKQEKEAYLHQEANAAANAALGIKRRRIADDTTNSDLAARFRKHVITQRDVLHVFEHDRHCQRTLIYYRCLLGLDEDGNPYP